MFRKQKWVLTKWGLRQLVEKQLVGTLTNQYRLYPHAESCVLESHLCTVKYMRVEKNYISVENVSESTLWLIEIRPIVALPTKWTDVLSDYLLLLSKIQSYSDFIRNSFDLFNLSKQRTIQYLFENAISSMFVYCLFFLKKHIIETINLLSFFCSSKTISTRRIDRLVSVISLFVLKYPKAIT